MYHLLILSLFSLKVSGEFIHGRFELIKDSQKDLIINTGYLVKEITTKSSPTKITCAKECFIHAQGHSTVCAGVVAQTGSCRMLFPDVGGTQGLSKINAVEVMHLGTIYLYRPQISKKVCFD